MESWTGITMAEKSLQKNEKYVRICPKCKSPDVYINKPNPLQSFLPAMYACNRCKHLGQIFPEVKLSKINELEEEVNKEVPSDTKKDDSSLVDASYGNFVVRVLWKITAPITILMGIFLLVFYGPLPGSILTLMGVFMFYITYFKKRKLKD